MYHQRGRTPLHEAEYADTVCLLLGAQADPNVVNNNGETPLHNACRWRLAAVVNILVNNGADVHAENKNGDRPLHLLIQEDLRSDSLSTLQELVSSGATWNVKCDLMVDTGYQTDGGTTKWVEHGPALRVCVHRWSQEHAKGLPLMEIPLEIVQTGAVATQTFIDEIEASKRIVFRRKICVVGPSNWGKTSLIKSLTTNQPSLVHADDRTIGIDHFSLSFDEAILAMDGTKRHEVTFWDFAGQDEYQVAHSLFFSARTLFLVCVDLESYTIAHMQADLMTDQASHADRLLNDFVESNILRWIRVIFARQPDAEFVFVATKKDRLLETSEELLPLDKNSVVMDLKKRLANVMVIVDDMKRELVKEQRESRRGESTSVELCGNSLATITHLGDPQLEKRVKPAVRLILSSCAHKDYVAAATRDVEDVIKASKRGFSMPYKYSLVLAALTEMKGDAAKKTTDERVAKTFVEVDNLVQALVEQVTDPKDYSDDDDSETSDDDDLDPEPYLSEATCRTILQTLHHLGDVLWYDAIPDDKLRNTVIVDPLLLIEFIRQVINHRHLVDTITHNMLSGLDFWVTLDDIRVLSMKRVLQHFHLVVPSYGVMRSDSDLIVPVYWKSNTSAFWLFGGDDLRLSRGIHAEQVAVRVHWELHFINAFPDSLFDHVVVASYSPIGLRRSIGPDWILYKENEGGEATWACRLVVGRDPTTHVRTLHLEALLGVGDVAQKDQDALWEAFEVLCDALALVLRGYPGLRITSCARDSSGGKPSLRSIPTPKRRSVQWLPPANVHATCRDLLTASQ